MKDEALYVGPPDQPDKYRLLRQVGAGGEARLWEAEIDLAGVAEPVALKALRVGRDEDVEAWQRRWAEQAEVLRFIRHPGVVGVREHFSGGGMHYLGEPPSQSVGLFLVMNWVAGVTLREWAHRHRAPADLDEAFNFLAQVGDVLDWLHSGQATPSGRPVIHADVTANNVIVTPAGQAVLVDFGLARLAAGLGSSVEGTGGYLAPEVRAAGAYSPASDRYAFGALAYFMVVGSVAPTELTELRSRLEAALTRAGRPDAVDPLMAMFASDPMARPACGDWIRSFRLGGSTSLDVGPWLSPPAPGSDALSGPHAVTSFAGASAASVVGSPGDRGAVSGSRRTKLMVAAAVLALSLGLVGVGLAWRGTDPDITIDVTTSSPTTSSSTTTTSTTTSTTSTTTAPTTTTAPPTTVAGGVTISNAAVVMTGDAIQITVVGKGFGTFPSHNGLLPCFLLVDEAPNRVWSAGFAPAFDRTSDYGACALPADTAHGSYVDVNIDTWTDEVIHISGLDFSRINPYYNLQLGDPINIAVVNAQRGGEPARFRTVVESP